MVQRPRFPFHRVGATADSILEASKSEGHPVSNPLPSQIQTFDAGRLAAQKKLKEAGFFDGVPDGYNTGFWSQGVRDFKNMAGLPVDDEYDARTEATLNQYLADGQVPGQRYRPIKKLKIKPTATTATPAPGQGVPMGGNGPDGPGAPAAVQPSALRTALTIVALTAPAWGTFLFIRYRR